MVLAVSNRLEEREFDSLQELMLYAWGKRYTPVQWGMLTQAHIRSGKHCKGESLCDILLKQILVGPQPSALIFSYFEHALGTLLISPLQFLDVIEQYALPEKSLQFAALIKLSTTFIHNLRAPEEDVKAGDVPENRYIFVAKVLFNYFGFLLGGANKSLSMFIRSTDEKDSPAQFTENAKLCIESALQMLKNRRLLALLVIGKYEFPEMLKPLLTIIDELMENPLLRDCAKPTEFNEGSNAPGPRRSSLSLLAMGGAQYDCSSVAGGFKDLLESLPCLIDDYAKSLTGSASGVFDDGDCDSFCSKGEWWALSPGKRIPSTSILLLMEHTLARWNLNSIDGVTSEWIAVMQTHNLPPSLFYFEMLRNGLGILSSAYRKQITLSTSSFKTSQCAAYLLVQIPEVILRLEDFRKGLEEKKNPKIITVRKKIDDMLYRTRGTSVEVEMENGRYEEARLNPVETCIFELAHLESLCGITIDDCGCVNASDSFSDTMLARFIRELVKRGLVRVEKLKCVISHVGEEKVSEAPEISEEELRKGAVPVTVKDVERFCKLIGENPDDEDIAKLIKPWLKNRLKIFHGVLLVDLFLKLLPEVSMDQKDSILPTIPVAVLTIMECLVCNEMEVIDFNNVPGGDFLLNIAFFSGHINEIFLRILVINECSNVPFEEGLSCSSHKLFDLSYALLHVIAQRTGSSSGNAVEVYDRTFFFCKWISYLNSGRHFTYVADTPSKQEMMQSFLSVLFVNCSKEELSNVMKTTSPGDLMLMLPSLVHEAICACRCNALSIEKLVDGLFLLIKTIPSSLGTACAWLCVSAKSGSATKSPENDINGHWPIAVDVLQGLLSPNFTSDVHRHIEVINYQIFRATVALQIETTLLGIEHVPYSVKEAFPIRPFSVDRLPCKVFDKQAALAFSNAFRSIIKNASMTSGQMDTCISSLFFCGPRVFCGLLLEDILTFQFKKETIRAADVGATLMMMNPNVTIPVMLSQIIPDYVFTAESNNHAMALAVFALKVVRFALNTTPQDMYSYVCQNGFPRREHFLLSVIDLLNTIVVALDSPSRLINPSVTFAISFIRQAAHIPFMLPLLFRLEVEHGGQKRKPSLPRIFAGLHYYGHEELVLELCDLQKREERLLCCKLYCQRHVAGISLN